MTNPGRLFFIHALSPLHAGTGQGVGAIDLPIAREKATNLPYVPGSSIKGVLRDRCEADSQLHVRTVDVFGPETDKAEEHAGSVSLTDARLLLLPVRSLAGTFAWVTSPFLLRRLKRDMGQYAGNGSESEGQSRLPFAVGRLPRIEQEDVECILSPDSVLNLYVSDEERVYLEDLDLVALHEEWVDVWIDWLGKRIWPGDEDWQTMLKEHLCVVPDDVLDFLAATATEVIARIRMSSDTKTVADQGLWYEEALPSESVLVGAAIATNVKADASTVFSTLESISKRAIQFGGDATVGRGLCTFQMTSIAATAKRNGAEGES